MNQISTLYPTRNVTITITITVFNIRDKAGSSKLDEINFFIKRYFLDKKNKKRHELPGFTQVYAVIN